jgi:peroxiredoxin
MAKLKYIILIVLSVILISSCSEELATNPNDSNNPAGLEVGNEAPDFAMANELNQQYMLSELKGQIVLLDFWATWCHNCVEELPNLEQLKEDYKSENFEILSVSLDDNLGSWRSFIKNRDLMWKHVADGRGWDNSAASLYDIRAIPYVYLIDQQGKIAWKGFVNFKTIRAEIEKLLD